MRKINIKNKKYVSFDIFDTLIKRNVAKPTDVFELVEKEYHASFKCTADDFVNKRINAEYKARTSTTDEVNLEKIYGFMNYSELKRKRLLDIELKIEMLVCVRNKKIYPLYEECIKNNIPVIIVSDMYLPQNIIEKILANAGYSKYIKLYLSSEIGVEKRTGKLFDYIVSDLNVRGRDIIHIGDSKRYDFLMALKKFVGARLIPKYVCNTSYLDSKDIFEASGEERFLFPFINNALPNLEQASAIGYEVLGPIIWCMCNWVHEQKYRQNIENLFFLARDAFLFEEAYRYIFPEENNFQYVYFSRKSLRLPYISKNSVEFLGSTLASGVYTINELETALNVEVKEGGVDKNSSAIKIDKDGSMIVYKEGKIFFEKAEKELMIKSGIQLELFYDYCRQINLTANSGIVDVGWHATIQKILENLLDYQNVQLTGLYFGHSDRKDTELLNLKTFWFSSRDSMKKIHDKLRITVLLERILLVSSLGTTESYRSVGESIEPQMAEKEIINQSYIDQLQKGAMTFVHEYKKYTDQFNFNFHFNCNAAFCAFEKLAYFPKYREAETIGNMFYEDTQNVHMAKPKKIIYYLVKPNIFLLDYRKSRWKEGFLKRLFPKFINVHSWANILGKANRNINNI